MKLQEEVAIFASIEAGVVTDMKQLTELNEKVRDDVAKADRALAEFLKNDDCVKNLGLDLDKIVIDEDAISDLERKEQEAEERRESGGKKFVSPYLSSPPISPSLPSPDAKKKKGIFANIWSPKKTVSKKDTKKWYDMLAMAAAERKTRDGCERLLNTYKQNPEKGSPDAMRELEYQIKELENKLRVLRIGCDQAIPTELLTSEQKSEYSVVFAGMDGQRA